MKKIFLPALLACAVFVQAQKNKQPIEFKTAITFSPLALLQVDYTALAGAEYRIKPKIGLAAELGFIFGSAYLADGDNTRGATGFMIRPAARFYLNERNSFYLQPQLFYKQVNNRMYDWVGKNCVDEVPAYEQLQDFTYRREVYGFNAVAGVLVPTRGHKVLFDFYLGLGVRYKNMKVVGIGNSCYQPPGFAVTFNDTEEGTFPSIPGGMRLVFVIN